MDCVVNLWTFLCVGVCLYVCILHHVVSPQMLEESVGSPETGVADACEPPPRCWELNPSLLQEQHALNCHLSNPVYGLSNIKITRFTMRPKNEILGILQ